MPWATIEGLTLMVGNHPLSDWTKGPPHGREFMFVTVILIKGSQLGISKALGGKTIIVDLLNTHGINSIHPVPPIRIYYPPGETAVAWTSYCLFPCPGPTTSSWVTVMMSLSRPGDGNGWWGDLLQFSTRRELMKYFWRQTEEGG